MWRHISLRVRSPPFRRQWTMRWASLTFIAYHCHNLFVHSIVSTASGKLITLKCRTRATSIFQRIRSLNWLDRVESAVATYCRTDSWNRTIQHRTNTAQPCYFEWVWSKSLFLEGRRRDLAAVLNVDSDLASVCVERRLEAWFLLLGKTKQRKDNQPYLLDLAHVPESHSVDNRSRW